MEDTVRTLLAELAAPYTCLSGLGRGHRHVSTLVPPP